jgi:hypothetical protein
MSGASKLPNFCVEVIDCFIEFRIGYVVPHVKMRVRQITAFVSRPLAFTYARRLYIRLIVDLDVLHISGDQGMETIRPGLRALTVIVQMWKNRESGVCIATCACARGCYTSHRIARGVFVTDAVLNVG